MKAGLCHLTLLLCLMTSFGIRAQDPVRFEASTNARQVVEGSYFELSFTLYNAQPSRFEPPPMRDFEKVSGPNRSTRTTYINGNLKQEVSFSYTLQPRKKGKLTIGSATVEADGKRLSTKPISVEVVEAKAGSLSEEQKAYIRAELSTTEAYIGQQITLNYKLYTTVDVESFNILQEADYQGFYATDVRRYNSRVMREVVNGVQYTTKILKQVALYPQQTGQLTISPINVQIGVIKEGSNRSRSFFFQPEVRRIPATTEPVTVNVKPLPEDAPPAFSGAVGNYSINVNLAPTDVSTDDAITLLMTVRGDGDIKRVRPPELQVPEGFELYDPKVVKEATFETGKKIVGKKLFEYLLLPTEAGTYNFNPTFTYFSPDSTAYVTLEGGAYQLQVRPGQGKPERPLDRTQEASAEELAPLQLDPSLQKRQGRFFGSPLFWGLSLAPFLLLFGLVGYRQWNRTQGTLDPALARQRAAQKMAQERLSQAKAHLEANQSRAFYDEVSKAMLGYICDKLQIPRSSLSKDNLRAQLQQLDLPQELVERILRIVEKCELALFAGKDSSSDMPSTYQSAKEAILQVEREVSRK